MVRVVHTIDGSRPAADAIEAAGATIGARSSSSTPPEMDVGFIDYPFRDPVSFPEHFGAVREHEPTIAVAPDLDGDRDPAHTYRQADRLADYADHVVIVPKNIPPGDVPDRFRLGVPFASGWSELAVEPWSERMGAFEDADRPLHILGGDPDAHRGLPPRIKDQVVSVDTSLPLYRAQFGGVWVKEGWMEIDHLDLYQRLEATLRNMRRFWGEDVEPLFDPPQGIRDFFAGLHGLRGNERTKEIRRQLESRGPPVVEPTDFERGIPQWVDEMMREATDRADWP